MFKGKKNNYKRIEEREILRVKIRNKAKKGEK